jgi:hypothetical protein
MGIKVKLPNHYIGVDRLRDMMIVYFAEVGTREEWCKENGVPTSSLSQFLTGKRPPSPKILTAIGVDEHILYLRKSINTSSTD